MKILPKKAASLGFLAASFFVLPATSQSPSDRACIAIQPENSTYFENWLNHKKAEHLKSTNVYRVPVVVHVLHGGDPEGKGFNIPLEQIESQLRVINEDFRRKEGTRGFNNHSDGGDTYIEFVLARSTPNNEPTNGINRVDITLQDPPPFGGSMVAIGAYYAIWDPYQYLNIWAFPGIQDTGLGEARFPVSDLPGLEDTPYHIPGFDSFHGIAVKDVDGIAINTPHFGEVNINSVYNLGRTGTHEIGHFLGLYHIWGDRGFDGGCDIDDYCDDTPNTSERTSGCPTDKLACDGSRAMIENYMDYTNDACMNIFTNDQIYRMRTVLENAPRRKSLLTSKALLPPPELHAPDISNRIRIYPNPAEDHFYIDAPDGLFGSETAVHIYDLAGNHLTSELYSSDSPCIQVIMPPVANGTTLIVKILAGDQTRLYKVVRK